jgi:hypothetical protein
MLLTEQSWSPLNGKFPLTQNTNLFATGKTVLGNRSRQFQTAKQTAVPRSYIRYLAKCSRLLPFD